MIDKIADDIYKIGFDNNKYLIAMLNEAKLGREFPNLISEQQYKDIKDNKETYPLWLVGFVGIGCSFAGKWFGGFARGGIRNYCAESKRNLEKQAKRLNKVDFYYGDYKQADSFVTTPETTVIYCDPPYAGTTKYHSAFDHKDFWDWCNKKINEGYRVFVSEYSAPDDWKSIWEKEVISSLDLNTGNKTSVEKLFTRQPI